MNILKYLFNNTKKIEKKNYIDEENIKMIY